MSFMLLYEQMLRLSEDHRATDLSDGQGSLPLFPIPRFEAIAATQLTRRRLSPEKFKSIRSV